MSDLSSLSLADLSAQLQARKVSATEVTSACLQRMEALEPSLGAMICVDSEGALAQAKALDEKGPDPEQKLWGVPVSLKDALLTKGLTTTAGSKMLAQFVPPYDAFVVERMRNAGCVILGKANMDEFAMGSTTENSAFHVTHNPWDVTRVPGGSSGGSAVSVASCECFASLGTDTGGSIRQPAALCGCVGLKPTYGRVSRYGVVAYGSSLDQVGPLARSVRDCARVLDVIAAHDPRDVTCAPLEAAHSEEAVGAGCDLSKITLGVPQEFFGDGLSDEVASACEETLQILAKAHVKTVPVSLSHTHAAIATYYIIAMAEASSNLARYDGVRYGYRCKDVQDLQELYIRSRTEGLGQEVRRRIMLGSFVLSSGYYDAYYRKAAQVRRIIRDEFLSALSGCDALFCPVSPVTAWPLGSHSNDPLAMYLMDAYTLSLNLSGLPGLSLPVALGRQSHLPVGMQLIGSAFCEEQLLALGAAIEREIPKIGQPKL